MWRYRFLLCLLVGAALSPRDARADSVCQGFEGPYRETIRKKIESGIPFELMSVLFENDQLLWKRAVHVTYDLWDEVVTVKEGDRGVGRFPIRNAAKELCRILDVDLQQAKGGESSRTYRLLFNPMWAERVLRLKLSLEGGEKSAGAGIVVPNWNKIAADMPSEQVLIAREWKP